MLFAAVRWSLLALSVISLLRVCPLLEQQRTKVDFGPGWFVRF